MLSRAPAPGWRLDPGDHLIQVDAQPGQGLFLACGQPAAAARLAGLARTASASSGPPTG